MLFGEEHVRRYEETDGVEGHDWQGTQTLILRTTGRKTKAPRKTPLIYGRHGDAYLVVASKGGAPEPPAWLLNLQASPEAEIQVRGEHLKVRARIATPAEKAEMWATMVKEWPSYDEYQTKTDREIPVVVLEPVKS
jgi:deazaflavin-dependent oxidoreductase (nitroreductase family)